MTVGPLCVRGHERAAHERRYQSPGRSFLTRVCSVCERDARHRRQAERAEFVSKIPDDLYWETFCRTIVARIEAVRRDEAMRERIEQWRRSA